jgi:hypothetical protein
MWSSLQLVKEGANPSLWRPYVLGDLEAKYWLLKDDIELTVDVPSVQGPVMVVDLPGELLGLKACCSVWQLPADSHSAIVLRCCK